MAKILTTTALVLFATCFAGGAVAQSYGTPDRIVLEAKSGSVMSSAGGEYQTANVGKQLAVGESVMLGDKSSATVVYYYGDRKCTERYVGANTYVIDDRCNPAAVAWVPGASNAAGAGIIIAAGVIGAALLNAMDDEPVGPLSAGPNSLF